MRIHPGPDADAMIQSGPPALLCLPGPDIPEPDPRRVLGICTWAAVLALIGLAVGGRALVAVAAGTSPGWYEPTVVVVGAVGIAVTVAAFMTVHHRRLPWALLAMATVPLGVNLAASAVAL